MGKQIDDGGPAFPVPDGEAANHGCMGMSLRDWFAGQALAGILANPKMSHGTLDSVYEVEFCSRLSYKQADAMLAARSAE